MGIQCLSVVAPLADHGAVAEGAKVCFQEELVVKVIVGRAPITRRFADDVGAGDYGHAAANAVERVKALVGVA
jgi:hypothetical protein